jgi:hypothetical protein
MPVRRPISKPYSPLYDNGAPARYLPVAIHSLPLDVSK